SARRVSERRRGSQAAQAQRRLPGVEDRQRRRRRPRQGRQVPERAGDDQRLSGRRRLPRQRPAAEGQDRSEEAPDRDPRQGLLRHQQVDDQTGQLWPARSGRADLEGLLGDQDRDPGSHRLAGRHGPQHPALEGARRVGAHLPHQEGHRSRAHGLGRLRPDGADRRQQDEGGPRSQPPRRVPHPRRSQAREEARGRRRRRRQQRQRARAQDQRRKQGRMSMRAVKLGLVVGGLLMVSAAAQAQSTNQIKPRVLLMVDTSGSMNFYLANNNPTGGDGSDTYISNAGVSRSQATTPGFALYEGYETNTPLVCAPHPVGPFEGSKSRLFNAKAAISNVINGSGDVDWGLMRYNGTDCSFSSTFNARGCTKNSNCASGQTCNGSGNCTCTNDNDCNYGEFCNDSTKVCGTDPNLCYTGNNLLVGMTDTRNKTTCGNHSGGETNTAGGNLPQTFQGGCGTNAGAGSTACGTP